MQAAAQCLRGGWCQTGQGFWIELDLLLLILLLMIFLRGQYLAYSLYTFLICIHNVYVFIGCVDCWRLL